MKAASKIYYKGRNEAFSVTKQVNSINLVILLLEGISIVSESVADEWSRFAVVKSNSAPAAQAPCRLHIPHQANDGKCQCAPVNEATGLLLGEDGEKRESNGDGCRQITLRGRESVCSGSSFQEEATRHISW